MKDETLTACFISPNESDRSLEAANVVDGLFAIARALNQVAGAINGLDEATLIRAIHSIASVIENK